MTPEEHFKAELKPLTIKEWKQFWQTKYQERQLKYMGSAEPSKAPQLPKISESGRHFEIAADYHTGRVLEVTGLEQVLDIEADKAKKGRAEFLVSIAHPDDLPKLLGLSVYFHRFAETLPEARRANFKGSVNFRMRKKNGEYIRVLEHLSYLQDSRGRISYEFKHFTDISHFHNADHIVLAILDDDHITQRQSLYTFDLEKKRPIALDKSEGRILTDREIEILRMIQSGQSSKQIASVLQLSPFTVNKHRENMLQKTQSGNIAEVLSFAYRNKYID